MRAGLGVTQFVGGILQPGENELCEALQRVADTTRWFWASVA